MKLKEKSSEVALEYESTPDAEERTQKIFEFLLKANSNKLKKSKKNASWAKSLYVN